MNEVDLHTHTTASDGSFPPAQLVMRAARLGLHYLGITDHDTTAGVAEAIAAGAQHGVTIIPGVEINTDVPGAEIHVLGYFVDPGDAELAECGRHHGVGAGEAAESGLAARPGRPRAEHAGREEADDREKPAEVLGHGASIGARGSFLRGRSDATLAPSAVTRRELGMTLRAGEQLGPYTVLGQLGAGGMGEVYRAHDTRLGRDVAIKVLSPHLAATPEVRARFEREARTISQLNHPHICTLFDVGHQEGVDYLVMELLEGQTLAHRLEKGPLPVAEVLLLGTQIAEALDRAHRAGVVHRDLKPGNVMLTRAGAKLMDFGLARAHGLAPAAEA